MKKALVLTSLLITGNTIAADFSPYIGLGYDVGGDTIGTVNFTDGSSDSIKAGDGLVFKVGGDVSFDDKALIRATVGYKIDQAAARNGDVEFTRVPFDLSAYKQWNRHALGGGVTHHSSVEFSCDIGICNDADFDSATGYFAEYLFLYTSPSDITLNVGLRYTDIDYDIGNQSFDGSAVGLHIGINF